MTPANQVTVVLSPVQGQKIKALLKKRRTKDPFIRKSDVLREVVDAGLRSLK
jgi:hypothetical protein